MRTLAILLPLALAAAVAGSAGAAVGADRVGDAGVSVALPQGWRAMPSGPSGIPASHDPVTRIAAASGRIAFGRGCNELDYAFPATAVAIVVLEWVRPTPSARWQPRPRHFTAAALPVRPPPALECLDGPGGSVQFAEHGRRLAAYVLLGRRAPPRLVARARAVLDTLRVGRAGRR